MSVPVLHARLLGEFQLYHGETPLTGALSPRLQSLLAYLLLHQEKSLSRQQLAFQFWPDSTEPQARTNLRKSLHRLRQLLPLLDDYLDLDGAVLAWHPGAPLSVDVAGFATLLRAAEMAGPQQQPAMLEAALALYKGKLLPGLYDDWVLAGRERLHQQLLDALELLAELHEARRAYSAASQAVRRLLREDPLRERGYRRLMRLQALGGDVAAALHTYHKCAALLEQELGVAPAPATQAAYHQLLKKRAMPPESPSLQAPRQLPLVGRDKAWQNLLAAWRAVAGGRSQVVLITGEAGIGKTRLAEELLTWAGRQGITCLRTTCFAADEPLPLAPVVGWLRAEPVQAALPALAPRWRGEVARLLPELLAGDPAVPAPQPAGDAWQKQQLFSALAAAIAAAGAPLLLFLDDLHWAGGETLAWLHFLTRHNQETPFLLLVTQRSEELAGNHALLTWQQEIARTVPARHITLARLDSAETATLAAHLQGAELDAETAAALFRATEGVPLFTVVMARAGLEGTAAELPQKIRAAIELHLDRLTLPARELVGLAALIGRSFSFPLLAAASPEPEDVVVRALDELWQRQVVREQAAAAGDEAYDFSHDQIRQVALAQLSAARRSWGHRRVAQALEQLSAPNRDARHGQIAAHWEGAGQPQKAAAHYARAAAAATRLYAHEEAVRQLRRALAMLPAGDPRCAELYARLGEAQILLSRYADAGTAFAQAAAATGDPVEQARLTGRRVAALNGRHQFQEAKQAYRQAMAILDAIPDAARDERAWRIWLDLQFSLLDVLYFEHQSEEMEPIVAAMAEPLAGYGTPRQRSQYYHFQARLQFLSLSFELGEEAIALAEESLHWAQQTGDEAFIASQTFTLGFALLWAGRLDAAIDRLQQAASRMETLGIVPNHSRSLTYLGIAYRLQGDEERLRRLLEQHAGAITADANPHYVGVTAAQRAWLAWRAGDLAAVQAHAQAALDQWGPLDATAYPIQWPARLPLLAAALASGQIASALHQAEILLSPHLQRLPAPVARPLAAAVAGSAAGATPLLHEAVSLAREHGYL